MKQSLSLIAMGLYGAALVGQVMLSEERMNIFQGKIEVPLEIMCKFDLKNVFPSRFVPRIEMTADEEALPKAFRLNRKTRPPNIRWAQ
ncbi:hypothetical protein [Beduini massiliensis]|uniref:hypothetical protein n=1 Tax=Beduini massiliensis TaxID=1585974 RepID=UPI00059A8AA5|nr:hypothetical protein [Beduini massiliensis]